MSEYHEKWEALPEDVRDQHRALQSLQEELEAVDWYNQRISVASDGELRKVLEHNREEEMEHAAMLVEWLRRNMEGWEDQLRDYLFTDEPIVAVESGDGGVASPGYGIGVGAGKGGD